MGTECSDPLSQVRQKNANDQDEHDDDADDDYDDNGGEGGKRYCDYYVIMMRFNLLKQLIKLESARPIKKMTVRGTIVCSDVCNCLC